VNPSDGVQFPPIANQLYEAAAERDLGIELPLSWFLQEYRT
jgi:hypothetical protein